MMTLDQHAARSRLRDVAPGYKLFFALPPIVLVLWADSMLFSLFVFLLMGAVLVYKGRVRPVEYLAWLAFPAGFLVAGTVAVAVDVSVSQGDFIVSVPARGLYAGVTSVGLSAALHLFFRALAAVSCLYFISFTTPVADIARSMSALGVPLLVIEITLLVYRFVFQLFDMAAAMTKAQKSRLGYTGRQAAFRSLSALASNLFVISASRSEETYVAMECRGYDGTIRVLSPVKNAPHPSLPAIAFLQLALFSIAYLLRYRGGI
jgi:cobalt/nickel transport system permease protein